MNNYRTVYEISNDIADKLSGIVSPDYYEEDEYYMFRLKDAKTFDTIKTYSDFNEFTRSDEYRKYSNSPVVDRYDLNDSSDGFYGAVWIIDTEAESEERDIA